MGKEQTQEQGRAQECKERVRVLIRVVQGKAWQRREAGSLREMGKGGLKWLEHLSKARRDGDVWGHIMDEHRVSAAVDWVTAG